MASKVKSISWSTLLLLLLSSALWFWNEWQEAKSETVDRRSSSTESDDNTATAAEERGYPVPITTAGYEAHKGCTWVDHRQNDGDSFRLKLPDGSIKQFRLYYVDAPESSFRTYKGGATNHERIHDQALDFGVTDEEVVEIGKKAKERVEVLLKDQQVTVFTKWEDPFGDERYSAFIRLPSGQLLHERLTYEGLVRVHTKGADLPDGMPQSNHQRHLEGIESRVRQSKQ